MLRRWLPTLAPGLVLLALWGVWQFVYHGVHPRLIFQPPPRSAPPLDLSQRVSVHVMDEDLGAVLARLSAETGVPITLEPPTLAVAGQPHDPVTLHIDDVPLSEAVELLCATSLTDGLVRASGWGVREKDGGLIVVPDPDTRDEFEPLVPRLYPLAAHGAELEGVAQASLAEAFSKLVERGKLKQLPAGILLTETEQNHRRAEQLLAALLHKRPAAGSPTQASWRIGPHAPSDALLARLVEPADVMFLEVPLRDVARELTQQLGLPVRMQREVLGLEQPLGVASLNAAGRPLRDVLDELATHDILWAAHGDGIWLRYGEERDVLEAPWTMSFYPIGDVLAALDHPHAPIQRTEIEKQLEDMLEYGNEFQLLGDILVVNSTPYSEMMLSQLETTLRDLRGGVFQHPAAVDWRWYAEFQRKRHAPFTLVCDEKLLSDRLKKLSKATGVPIDFEPAVDPVLTYDSPFREPPPTDDDPFGEAAEKADYPAGPTTVAPWKFENESLNNLDTWLYIRGYFLLEKHERLIVTKTPFELPSYATVHSLHEVLTANAGRLTANDVLEMIQQATGFGGRYSGQYPSESLTVWGAALHVQSASPAVHAAAAEIIEKLCEHARHPPNAMPLLVNCLPEAEAAVFPIGDLVDQWEQLILPSSMHGYYPCGEYLVVTSDRDVARYRRLLAALRGPRHPPGERRIVELDADAQPDAAPLAEQLARPVTYREMNVPLSEAARRMGAAAQVSVTADSSAVEIVNVQFTNVPLGAALRALADEDDLIAYFKEQGFELRERELHTEAQAAMIERCYEAPELTRLATDEEEHTLLDVDDTRPLVNPYRTVSGIFAPHCAPPAWSSVWRPIDAQQRAVNLPLALSALLESSSPGFGSPPEATRYGDHIVVRAPLLAHAALQQRLAQIASPAMLARVPTTITLLADDEPLGEALERWSLAERVPLIVIEPGELEPHLVRRITCNVQAMPWADFLRTQKIELTAVNAGGVLMLRPRRPNDDHPFDDTQTELIDLRAMRAKYPEIDNRQLVEWLVAATDVGGPYSERLFDDDRSLVATGDVLIVRHLPETIATVRKQVAKLAMGAFTELPRPALLFSDDPQRAIDQYLAALASTADEDLASFAAYWLCQTRPLDSAQVAPLIRALDACDLRARPRLAQAICRVLAAHRTAAGDALPVLVAKFDHAAPAPVRSALLAALGSLGADSAVPLAKLMRHAQRDDAEQIVCHLWTLGDDARPALPLLLSWALIDTTAPDKRVCRALFNRGGLVHRLDPDAIQLAECLRQWEVHTDAKYRAAFAKADAYFRAWPEYIAAQEHAPLAVEDIPFLQRYTWPPFHRAGEGEMFWNDADDIEQGAMP